MSSIQFKNTCKTFPIIISSWVYVSQDVSKYRDIIVLPETEVTLHSSVGEWIVSSMFYTKEYIDLWKNAALESESRMAKFRNEPCAMGNYTWNFSRDFEIKYENGVVLWSYKNEI
jgi:hypothetical protein